jgi:hypothetical protein
VARPDLPADIYFEANEDGYRLDQVAEIVRHVQLFREGTQFIVELWGQTSLMTPDGDRFEGREFQQNSWITFTEDGGFKWEVKRIVYDDETHTVKRSVTFKHAGVGPLSFRRRI